MPRTYGKALLTTTAIVAVFLCASTARAVGGIAFVHTYINGDMGMDGISMGRLTGSNIGVPTLPLTPRVRVELLNSDGNGWDAVYGNPVVNDTQRFRALAD